MPVMSRLVFEGRPKIEPDGVASLGEKSAPKRQITRSRKLKHHGSLSRPAFAKCRSGGAQLRRLEIVAFIEATTLLLLVGVAVPLKHFAGWPLGVRVLGPLHGLAFLSFFWIGLQTVAGDDWTLKEKVRLLLLAFVPLGGYFKLPLIARKLRSLGQQE